MTARLRTMVFQVVFWGLSIPIVLGAPLAALFGTRAVRRHVRMWLSYHGWCARNLLGITTRLEGVPFDGPALYAGKHQAMYETLELTRLLDEPVVVMKRELGDIPVWGWTARRYGMIVVDRTASSAALRQLMRDAKAVAAEGRSVMIFAEGTRVRPGERPAVKSGLAGLYKALGLPLIPVALDSGLVLPKEGPAQPGVVTMRFGPPILPGLPRAEVEAAVHLGINALEDAPAAR